MCRHVYCVKGCFDYRKKDKVGREKKKEEKKEAGFGIIIISRSRSEFNETMAL